MHFFQDTPTTAREALFALHKVYVERSGGSFETGTGKKSSGNDQKIIQNGDSLLANGDSNDSDVEPKKKAEEEEQCICEISPLLSYAGENLEKFIEAKKVFTSPALLD